MKARLERAMERYGQTVTLASRDGDEAQKIRAFLQPVLKTQAEPPVAVTPLGPVREHRWLYIGRADLEVRTGDRMSCGGVKLVVQETQPVYWQDEAFYWRAILRREKEAAD